jgi:hypothetical protein
MTDIQLATIYHAGFLLGMLEVIYSSEMSFNCVIAQTIELLKNGVFWDVMPCGSCKNLTRAIRHNISEDAILHSHHCEDLKS